LQRRREAVAANLDSVRFLRIVCPADSHHLVTLNAVKGAMLAMVPFASLRVTKRQRESF